MFIAYRKDISETFEYRVHHVYYFDYHHSPNNTLEDLLSYPTSQIQLLHEIWFNII